MFLFTLVNLNYIWYKNISYIFKMKWHGDRFKEMKAAYKVQCGVSIFMKVMAEPLWLRQVVWQSSNVDMRMEIWGYIWTNNVKLFCLNWGFYISCYNNWCNFFYHRLIVWFKIFLHSITDNIYTDSTINVETHF